MENDNHEIYGNPRNTGRRGLQVEAKTKSLLWPHSIGIRGPHSSNTKKGAKTSNSGVERNVIRYCNKREGKGKEREKDIIIERERERVRVRERKSE